VTFSWNKLRAEVAKSKYLLPEDDLTTQHGIITAVQAVMDRMANGERLREVSWEGLASKRRKAMATASNGKGSNGKNGSGPAGNSLIVNPQPLPVSPGPAPAYADYAIEF
jgi:hypothetical protein